MARFATSGNVIQDSLEAIQQACDDLKDQLGSAPTYLMVQLNAGMDITTVQSYLSQLWPDTHLHGATSCLGTMTDKGVMMGENCGLSLFGILADNDEFGVGLSYNHDGMAEAAQCALERALINAEREGELPYLLWVSCSPGNEEDVLKALQDEIGDDIPIIGGSAADNEIAGHWKIFTNNAMTDTGCLISAFFLDIPMGSSFQSAYLPTIIKATITDADKRLVKTLDGQLAGKLYAEWAELDPNGPRNILGETSLSPLGRLVGTVRGTDIYRLSHPESITEEGYLTLFSDVEIGEELVLMDGTKDMLIKRAGRVCKFAQNIGGIENSNIAGAILVYCAGCMLSVQEDVDEIRETVKSAIGNAPFITAFTFGEQGQVIAGQNCHGNLMISALVWGE